MEVLRNASGVKIKNSNFSNIGRDQNNNYTTFKAKNIIFQNHRVQRVAKHVKELELSEYTEVKRGDIYRIRDIYYRASKNGAEEKEDIYIAEITSNSSTRKFMVKAFVGPLAQKRWRQAYLKFSHDRNVNLYGYNKSSIPSLIFHGELVPLAHFEDRLSNVGHYYIMLMRSNWQCTQRELWIDPIKGVLCHGPVGPQCHKRLYPADSSIMVPSTLDLLEGDVMIRYFTTMHSRLGLLETLVLSAWFNKFESTTATNDVYFISTQTGFTIASSQESGLWRCFPGSCLDSGIVMPGGLTSYDLNNSQRFLELYCTTRHNGWIAQALSVFHAFGISMDEDLSQYSG
ncbi:hypothetical protein L218DRAFT_997373 [Marasmius fiardii PR-910]|nr:hypothetical protein L218DRAFT_997373 [Marasmius fiardii PR-910]